MLMYYSCMVGHVAVTTEGAYTPHPFRKHRRLIQMALESLRMEDHHTRHPSLPSTRERGCPVMMLRLLVCRLVGQDCSAEECKVPCGL